MGLLNRIYFGFHYKKVAKCKAVILAEKSRKASANISHSAIDIQLEVAQPD